MAKATNVKAQKSKSGDVGFSLSQINTDSPIIPIEAIERLHKIRPDKVDWFFEQTKEEADFRRKNDIKVNKFIFIERMTGQIFGLLTGFAGIAGSCYLGMHDHEILGGTIATATIATLAGSFIMSANKKNN